MGSNVRKGSLADISERIRDVRFTPDSGHAERKHRRPLCAISGSWGQNVHQPLSRPPLGPRQLDIHSRYRVSEDAPY